MKLLSASLALAAALAAIHSAQAMPKYDHILVVVEENDDAKFVLNGKNTPYFNKVLVPHSALMTDAHGYEHPSQPNYLILFSGSDQFLPAYSCNDKTVLSHGWYA